ncbi:MAG TPA: tetratricopeptide repeat protein [Verrucomicrobiae bacterium]|nr:tetratricopeptide repeat protein [Verrucomicrobiae bacterium]
MLATKNISWCGGIVFLALAIFLTGCGPAGPRALLKGEKLLSSGDYSGAVAELKTATSLMSTNAQAWNYLGVAYQHADQPADAALAYQRALALDRDLAEAHYNLGCLWLEQNKPDVARTEFTAYVLRRSKDPEGWTKLGMAQLRLHDLTAAEKAFNTALAINSNAAGALNGLGLAQMQRGRPRDASQYFAAAKRAQPDYAPALLNLATVARQYLHDNALALQNYRAYLALTPHRPDWDQVNAIADNLEQTMNGTANPAGSNRQVASVPPRSSPTTGTPTLARSNPGSSRGPGPEAARVQPAPAPIKTPGLLASGEAPPKQTNGRPGVLHQINPMNWFRNASPEPNETQPASSNSNHNPVKPVPTPAPTPSTSNLTAFGTPTHTQTKPVRLIQPAPPSFPRYLYLSPAPPRPGNRPAAGRAFARAQQFEQAKQYLDALDSYREAARLDPGWFEAQYNCGVMAYRLGDFNESLPAYEMALAIQPDSVGARYNFALGLQAAGYVTDAVNELKKILASKSDDVRAHLALGNIYAQQLYDVPQARAQYLRVLQLDPGNAQAAEIQFWLSSNPP